MTYSASRRAFRLLSPSSSQLRRASMIERLSAFFMTIPGVELINLLSGDDDLQSGSPRHPRRNPFSDETDRPVGISGLSARRLVCRVCPCAVRGAGFLVGRC